MSKLLKVEKLGELFDNQNPLAIFIVLCRLRFVQDPILHSELPVIGTAFDPNSILAHIRFWCLFCGFSEASLLL